jgi:Protein of unknown function (DUF4031)
MLADDMPELQAFAARLGCRPDWYQPRSFPHFDLPLFRRAEAIRLGAVQLDRRQLGLWLRRAKAGRPPVFVFGSNLAGRHGKGAALYARSHRGAVYGQGEGLQGDAYGIPTKCERLRTLPLEQVERHIARFANFAWSRPDLQFQLTPVGCGLAGFNAAQIKPLFSLIPDNVILPAIWQES